MLVLYRKSTRYDSLTHVGDEQATIEEDGRMSGINSVKAAGVVRYLPWGQFYLPTPEAFTQFNRLMNAHNS